ncbi:peptidase domain-containing ABC transporter [Asticcacaulis sp.]|uniref:peptidase domain-containing ABC transporter n=1 Tax=Asticcacaulis sp. TaxID=1872648 RepID=UPI002631EB9C|nr:peptidase domain-containing ABC transporter [Asticcacaulis sp.]
MLQTEAAECGLACLAMIASHHGASVDLFDLRRLIALSRKGVNLRGLVEHASRLGFTCRPLGLEIEEVSYLKCPCIVHWDMNHFVVLQSVGSRYVTVIDPAVGKRRLSLKEFSSHFTGIALELTPAAEFQKQAPAARISLSALTGKVRGLWRALFQVFALAVVLELFSIAAPIFQQMVVDDVLTAGDRDLLTIVVLGFGLLLVVQTAIGLARSWMVIFIGQVMSLQWSGNVFAHLLRLPVSFFEKRHLGDIVSRFGSVGAIQHTLTTAVIEAVLDGMMATAALIMMLIYAPTLAAVTVVAVLLYGILRWASYSPFRNASAERLVVAAKENTHFLETLRAITPLKLFGREEERRARWQNLVVGVQNRDVRTACMSMWFSTANTFVFGVENLLVLWLGAKLIMDGMTAGGASSGAGMTIGMLFAFISYKGQFSGRVSALINYAVDLKMLGLHAERLADICLEPPEKDDVPTSDLSHLSPSIELKGVSFRYGDGEPWILKDANFKIEAGESVAVVGASGCGKTTLLKIALGLLKPIEGDVFYGGQPVRQLGISNYRRQIGTVMQEDVLLTGSLADNIAFFDVHLDQARVEACARLAQLHDDICRMPMGYQTLVGDLGSGLSGGQKQRLLLARALYKQPCVLALDEATSDLDIGNERAVTAALSQLALTRLIVAHRPETIAGARRVVQLVNGQVMEVARAVSPVPSMAEPFPVLD